jgi:acetyl esterase/lipase
MDVRLIRRRDVLGAGAALATVAAGLIAPDEAQAQAASASPQVGPDTTELPVPGAERVALWPASLAEGRGPGDTGAAITRRVRMMKFPGSPIDRWVSGIAQPVMMAFRPTRPNGSAMLIMPGGGYAFQSFQKEGVTVARWMAARGTAAFVLMYRLPGEGWNDRSLVPLQDAQRAMRVIRARAKSFGVDPARVMAMGFSAGGHLAGSLATRFAEKVYAPVDEADALSARPDLAALIYPVVSMMPGLTHAGSRDLLLGKDAPEVALRAASLEQHVPADLPPLYLTHAIDDTTVPVGGTLALFDAVRERGRIVDLHVVAKGGHGFGMELPVTESGGLWPQELERFAMSNGVVRKV